MYNYVTYIQWDLSDLIDKMSVYNNNVHLPGNYVCI